MLSSPAAAPPPPASNRNQEKDHESTSDCRWRTESRQRQYNRRLLDALRAPQDQRRSRTAREIKDAADSALALTARGQSRWSRAILTTRRKVLLRATAGKVRRRKPRKPAALVKNKQPAEEEEGEGRRVRERLRRLGRLVPGCSGGKLPAGSLLEEAADYVAALEVQVRAMRALADALAAATITSAGDQVGPAEE